MITRRSLLATTLLSATALAACQTSAPAVATGGVGTIRVDVSRLVELGVGPRAATIKAGLERELARLLAPSNRPGGAVVSVAVRGLTLASYAGGDVDDGAGSDFLESIVTVAGAGGQTLASYPILSQNGAGDAGVWYDPNLVDKRVERVVVNHALWIRRYVGR